MRNEQNNFSIFSVEKTTKNVVNINMVYSSLMINRIVVYINSVFAKSIYYQTAKV